MAGPANPFDISCHAPYPSCEWVAGREAFPTTEGGLAGHLSLWDNPYKRGTTEWFDWLCGWAEAYLEATADD